MGRGDRVGFGLPGQPAAREMMVLAKRAEELGFKLIDPKTAVYLEIPGYDPENYVTLAPPRVSLISESPIIRSSYKVSLWDWFMERIWQMPLTAEQPVEEIIP